MGGSRKLEIRVVSAEDLPDIFLMTAYAKVSVGGITRETPVDWEGENNPTWNSEFVFDIKESYLEQGGLDVVVNLFRTKILKGDKFVGQVRIPVKNLFQKKKLEAHKSLTYPISGTPYGKLNIRYRFLLDHKSDPIPIVTTRYKTLKQDIIYLPLPLSPPPPPPPPSPPRKPVVTEMNLNFRTIQYLDDVS